VYQCQELPLAKVGWTCTPQGGYIHPRVHMSTPGWICSHPRVDVFTLGCICPPQGGYVHTPGWVCSPQDAYVHPSPPRGDGPGRWGYIFSRKSNCTVRSGCMMPLTILVNTEQKLFDSSCALLSVAGYPVRIVGDSISLQL